MIIREEIIGDCRLLLGDCREILPGLGRVNHIISDPPYEEELHKAVGKIRRNDGVLMPTSLGFDGINLIRDEISGLCVSASEGWVLLFTLAEGVREWRDGLQKFGAKYDTCLAWIKPDAMPRFNGQGAARGFECAVTAWCGTGYRSWNGGGKRGVFTHCVNTDRQGEHPTEKPIPLMLELVELYTNQGETVLDPFCGSGSTGVACAKRNRKFIGIEQNEKWFDLACKRIRQAYAQPDMFIEPTPKAKRETMI